MKNSILCILLLFGTAIAMSAQNAPEENELQEILQDDDYDYDYDAPEYDGPSPTELYKQEDISRRELDRKAWRKATEGLDYSGGQKKKAEGAKGEGDPGGGSPKGPQTTLFNTNSEIGAAFLKILVILIAAVALFFLLRGLLGMKGPRNRKVKTAELLGLSLEDIEENFQELALEDFIRNAVERKEFALAIRLYYLAVLKELATQELIRWKKDKTNLDYIHEMRPTELGAPFREITRIFEWAWYGRQTVSEEDFALLEPKMKGFLHRTSNVAAKGG